MNAPVDDPARTPVTGAARLRVGAGWIAALVLAMIGVYAGWFGPIQILLPGQAEQFETAGYGGKETILAVCTGVGAAISMIANPLWGFVSDRRAATAGRRGIVIAGTGVAVAGLLVLAAAPNPALMLLGWILVQIGLNGPQAGLAASIADRVPERQRGTVGSLFGIAQMAGVVTGTGVAALGGTRIGYLVLAVAVPALIAAWTLIHTQGSRPGPHGLQPESHGLRTGLVVPRPATLRPGGRSAGVRRGIRVRPSGQFGWAWAVRFLMNTGNSLMLLYLYFYLDDEIGVADPAGGVLVVTVSNIVIAALAAGFGGYLSDRLGRRRGFAVVAGAVTVAGNAVLAVSPGFAVVLVGAAVAAVGWGLYLAVDMAIVTATLTEPDSFATMLGVANVANALPQVVAPVLAAPLLAWGAGYGGVFGAAAVAALFAIVCARRLRLPNPKLDPA